MRRLAVELAGEQSRLQVQACARNRVGTECPPYGLRTSRVHLLAVFCHLVRTAKHPAQPCKYAHRVRKTTQPVQRRTKAVLYCGPQLFCV